MYEEFFSLRLAELRMQKGVSARDMSLSIGQSENYINKIENRKSLPSMHAFFFICEYLGVTPAQFFDKDNQNPALLNDALSEIRKLDEASLAHIMGLAKEINAHK
ncbi:helix-turn-helix domain-containing protein [Anaeromassilibacillus sp. SJQ-5]